MTNREFSNSFDTLVNSFQHKASFGEESSRVDVAFDEYEKSVFLTQAQENLVISYYNGKNSYSESFEKTEELRRYLSSLIKTAELIPDTNYSGTLLDTNSQVFSLPEDLWFITYETAYLGDNTDICLSGKEVEITPITQDDFFKTKKNPFRGISAKALRLDLGDNKVEIVSKFSLKRYIVRYIKELTPIILTDLPEGLEIRGESNQSECELNSALHEQILLYAVDLALKSKGITLNNK